MQMVLAGELYSASDLTNVSVGYCDSGEEVIMSFSSASMSCLTSMSLALDGFVGWAKC